jgi:cellulose synthase/poly-beta-1,6-N-acetylglucosamine synthase-like glycosyltransferase
MISVVTPTFHTDPDVLARTWASLKAQTYTDWEWVVWDDSRDDRVWRHLYGLAADERYRIVAHRSHVHSGSIGQVKRRGFMAAEGDVLVELDHDDELTPDCLQHVADAFADPQVGFVYSDWCELLPSGESGRYPEGWAFGYGTDYWSAEHGVWVMSAPPLNRVTLGHIVSAPNHVRAWRADVYRQVGGHDPALTVADDYDLVVRTALATGCLHVPRMLYRQHVSPSTAQRTRNGLIQTEVARLSAKYAAQLDDRFPV